MRDIRRIFTLILVCMSLGIFQQAQAQNFFNNLKNKITNRQSGKDDKKKSNSASLDIQDLSLDENLLIPEIPEKSKAAVKDYMNNLAKKLASRKKERIETMRGGEVVIATLRTDLIFPANDTVLNGRAEEMLAPYSDLLRQKGMYKLLLVVHTDDTGSESYTERLSEKRVGAVYDFLSEKSGSDDMVAYGFGASDPLSPNNSHDNRARNRRLEIYIVPEHLMIEMAKSQNLKY